MTDLVSPISVIEKLAISASCTFYSYTYVITECKNGRESVKDGNHLHVCWSDMFFFLYCLD